ncbi:MAG: HAD-IIIC family phosphatase [Paenibacillus dendritiformis]|uniref:HAD-IIIC family phosphatase n=1 Tax=uncultured Paenibacillus sp. TaxID=227322 RepID=UPI0025ED0DA6|nr:HAD-IIIC family phosphatase [uncultured Paenibacillus sp.]MDU5142245.1 HAD-IIIC family phosphatase [Paenibacillus dendritiformis]
MNHHITAQKEKQKIKCIVWDLDNTLWDGILLEDSKVSLRDGVVDIIKTADSRGILQSVASKNEHQAAMNQLEEFGLAEYFIYPQINWNAKSSSIAAIARAINIGLDTIAFIDDQPFEREEVQFVHPEVLCIDAAALPLLPSMPEMNPNFITEDSRNRRKMYLCDMKRNRAEESFTGTHEEFLASLNMKFTISRVGEGDLQRAEELTVRTHQLNTTGYTYSYEEIDQLRKSETSLLLISDLEDKYGTYGKIGLALVELGQEVWTIKLLLMSCRVMSRGVGTVMLNHIMNLAQKANVTLRADFVSTDKNRAMYVTYKFAGFQEVHEEGDFIIFENNLSAIQPLPDYIQLVVQDEAHSLY